MRAPAKSSGRAATRCTSGIISPASRWRTAACISAPTTGRCIRLVSRAAARRRVHPMRRGSIAVASALAILVATMVVATQDQFPEGRGKSELLKVCKECHGADIVLANLKSPAEWTETLQNMAQQGAEATPDEWRLIEHYIDVNFALVMVNKAPADELQLTMELTPEVVAALVKYRQEQGPFKSIDDVKKVPGIDGAGVEARRKRIVF